MRFILFIFLIPMSFFLRMNLSNQIMKLCFLVFHYKWPDFDAITQRLIPSRFKSIHPVHYIYLSRVRLFHFKSFKSYWSELIYGINFGVGNTFDLTQNWIGFISKNDLLVHTTSKLIG